MTWWCINIPQPCALSHRLFVTCPRKNAVYVSLWNLACDCSDQKSILEQTRCQSRQSFSEYWQLPPAPSWNTREEAHLVEDAGPGGQPAPTRQSCGRVTLEVDPAALGKPPQPANIALSRNKLLPNCTTVSQRVIAVVLSKYVLGLEDMLHISRYLRLPQQDYFQKVVLSTNQKRTQRFTFKNISGRDAMKNLYV